jgi:hypothetical protein
MNAAMKRVLTCWCAVFLAAGMFQSLPAEEARDVLLIHASIYRGQNEDLPDSLADFPGLKKSLVRLFGYPHYERLGVADSLLPQAAEVVLRPSKCMTFSVMPLNAETGRYPYRFSVQEKEHFRGEFAPKPEVPLIIKGPQHGKGLLILVVTSSAQGAHSPAP